MTPQRPSVAVLGSGISGLVAALELAERGLEVTVLEAAAFAGGRTSSWNDARGRPVDSGIHMIADHYHNLLEVLRRVGADDLQWYTRQLYLRPGKTPITWSVPDLPAPFHLFGSTSTAPLSFGERVKLASTSWALLSRTHAELEELEGVTYADWLKGHGVDGGFIAEMGDSWADAITFLSAREVSARSVLTLAKLLMRSPRAWRHGTWKQPMAESFVARMVSAIERAGGKVRLNAGVVGFGVEGQKVTSIELRRCAEPGQSCRGDGSLAFAEGAEVERLPVDCVVSALPVQSLRRVLGRDLAYEAGLSLATTLENAPAMSLRVWFDRPITPGTTGCPLVGGGRMRGSFDFGAALGQDTFGTPNSVYGFTIGMARERMGDPDEKLVKESVEEFVKMWPPATGARVVDFSVERHEGAMVACVPGAYHRRPGAATRIPNLFLAGDWTKHALNISMEAAALSGKRAASHVLESYGERGVRLLEIPDEPAMRVFERLGRGLRAQAPARY